MNTYAQVEFTVQMDAHQCEYLPRDVDDSLEAMEDDKHAAVSECIAVDGVDMVPEADDIHGTVHDTASECIVDDEDKEPDQDDMHDVASECLAMDYADKAAEADGKHDTASECIIVDDVDKVPEADGKHDTASECIIVDDVDKAAEAEQDDTVSECIIGDEDKVDQDDVLDVASECIALDGADKVSDQDDVHDTASECIVVDFADNVSDQDDVHDTASERIVVDYADKVSEADQDDVHDVASERIAIDCEDKAPDGGWGWCIVAGVLLLRTVIGGFGRSHGLFYLRFRDRYQGTATATAMVTSVTAFVRLSSGPIVSVLVGRFQCRTLAGIGTLLYVIGIFLTCYSPSLIFLYVCYGVIVGLGRSLALTPCPIILGYYFDKRRSLAFGIASAGFSIGGFAITPLVELLFGTYGFQGAFLILTAFSMNLAVAVALFRPIETHRRLLALDRTQKESINGNSNVQEIDRTELEQLVNVEPLGSGASIYASSLSLNRAVRTGSASHTNDTIDNRHNYTSFQTVPRRTVQKVKAESYHTKDDKTAVNVTKQPRYGETNEQDDNAVEITLEQRTGLLNNNVTAEDVARHKQRLPWTRYYRRMKRQFSKKTPEKAGNEIREMEVQHKKKTSDKTESETKESEKKRRAKKKLMSWSILKDVRFVCFVFASFCYTLPTGGVFLPALAQSKGCTELQGASLLSIMAGVDTLFRVISGVILDMKAFRTLRPQIYNIVTFLQAVTMVLYPFMASYRQFVAVCVVEGAFTGIRMAQGNVVVMDMLGVEKLTSCLATIMAVQCIAVLIGPAVAGQLVDIYGTYEGAFYFGAAAVFIGGVVMAAGILYNYAQCKNKNKTQHRETVDRINGKS